VPDSSSDGQYIYVLSIHKS